MVVYHVTMLKYVRYKYLFFYLLQNDEIDQNLFTFEAFYQLYAKVCPRQDFDQIFTKW